MDGSIGTIDSRKFPNAFEKCESRAAQDECLELVSGVEAIKRQAGRCPPTP